MSRQPVDFSLNAQNPLDSALKGYQTGLAIQQNLKVQAQQEQARKQAMQMRDDLAVFTSNPNKTRTDFQNIMTKYPQLSENIKRSFDIFNEDQKESAISRMSQVYSALDTGNTDVALETLKTQKQAAINSGNARGVAEAKQRIKQLETNPEIAKTSLALGLESLGIDTSKIGKTETTKTFQLLTDAEKKASGLDLTKQYQRSSDGKISPIGSGSGVTVNLGSEGKLGPIPAGYVVRQNESGSYEMYPIEGGPAKDEAAEKKQKEAKTQEMKAQSNVIVTDNIDDAIKMLDDSTFLKPVTGVWSKVMLEGFNQKKANLTSKLNTIRAAVSFDTLAKMREASKTGGALGAVSERELTLLMSTMGALDQDQSAEQLKGNLQTIKDILKKDEAYRARVAQQMKTNISAEQSTQSLVDKYLKSGGK